MDKRRRDKQRARCPDFSARVDYRGRSYIACGGYHWEYPDSSGRESQYRTCCCGCYEQCSFYKAMEENQHDDAGKHGNERTHDTGGV